MKINEFFKFIGFELKKIFNCKLVFVFIVFAPMLICCIFGIYANSTMNTSLKIKQNNGKIPADIVFVADGEVDNKFYDLIESVFSNEVTIDWQDDLEDAIIDLKLSNISLIIYVDGTIEGRGITIIYDTSNAVSTNYKDILVQEGYKYSYYTIKDALSEYGITIEDFTFKTESIDDSDNTLIKGIEPNAIAIILAFVLAVGISYTMARDNETGVIKQLAYTPMSSNKYLFIRWCFFAFLTIVQSLIMLIVLWIFGAPNGRYFFGLWGISILFGMAFNSLSLLLSTSKNQLSSICLSVFAIIVPIILVSIGITGANILLTSILYLSPITPFILSFKTYLYYGTTNFVAIVVMVCEIIIYYLLTKLILNKKTSKKINN